MSFSTNLWNGFVALNAFEFQDADRDGSGSMDFQEFVEMMIKVVMMMMMMMIKVMMVMMMIKVMVIKVRIGVKF